MYVFIHTQYIHILKTWIRLECKERNKKEAFRVITWWKIWTFFSFLRRHRKRERDRELMVFAEEERVVFYYIYIVFVVCDVCCVVVLCFSVVFAFFFLLLFYFFFSLSSSRQSSSSIIGLAFGLVRFRFDNKGCCFYCLRPHQFCVSLKYRIINCHVDYWG